MRRRAAILLLGAAPAAAPILARAADAVVEIPVVTSLTGGLAPVGAPLKQALDAHQKWVNANGGINKRPLQYTVSDDNSNLETTVQIVNGFVAKKVPVFLGPVNVAANRVAAPLVSAAGPVQYGFSPGSQTTGYSFASGYSTPAAFQTMLPYFHGRGIRRIAVLNPNDATGQDGDRALADAMALPAYRDMTLVANEHFNTADISLAGQLSRIKATDPQLLVAWATGTPAGNLLRNARDAGMDVPIYTSHGNLSYPIMKQYGDLAPKAGLYFAGPLFLARDVLPRGPARAGVEAFAKALEADGLKADALYSLSWDAGTIVVDALRHVGPNPTADVVRAYIEQIHGLPGSAAVFDFRDGSHRGISPASILMARWNSQKNTFDPVSQPGGKPIAGR